MTDATVQLRNPAGSAPRGFTYPRRCDAIAARGHRHLVAVIGLGTVLLLVWAALTTLEKVTRGSGRVRRRVSAPRRRRSPPCCSTR